MRGRAGQHEEMPDLVIAEDLRQRVRTPEHIDHRAERVGQAAGDQPAELLRVEPRQDPIARDDDDPAEAEVDRSAQLARAVDPGQLEHDPGDREAADQGEVIPT